MNFKYRLARRLAEIRVFALVLLPLAGAACAGDSLDSLGPPDAGTDYRPQLGTVLSSTSCKNEPAGLTRVTDQPWGAVPPQYPALDAYGWTVETGRGRLAQFSDAAAKGTAPTVLQAKFPQGLKGGTGPFHLQRKTPIVKQLYQCFWMKVAKGFTNNGNTGTKLAFILNTSTAKQYSSQAYINGFDKTSDAGFMGVNVEAPNTQGRYNREMPTNFKWSQHFDEWHQFEVLMIANSKATANGVLRIWVDGALDIAHTNVKWFIDEAKPNGFKMVDITPTYGGGTHPVPYNMYWYFDHWRISGK